MVGIENISRHVKLPLQVVLKVSSHSTVRMKHPSAIALFRRSLSS
ncbi:MAG: hypothetical protein V7L23_23910 [Nostoc sp.]